MATAEGLILPTVEGLIMVTAAVIDLPAVRMAAVVIAGGETFGQLCRFPETRAAPGAINHCCMWIIKKISKYRLTILVRVFSGRQ